MRRLLAGVGLLRVVASLHPRCADVWSWRLYRLSDCDTISN